MGAGKQAEGGLWGLRPGKPQSEAAQKILAAASNKFASAGKLDVADSSAGGLSVKKEKVLEPTPQQVRFFEALYCAQFYSKVWFQSNVTAHLICSRLS